MRASRESRRPHQADSLPLMNSLPVSYENSRQVEIVSLISARMCNANQIPVATLTSRKYNPAIRDCLHGRSHRRRVVRSQVGAADLKNWMIAMGGEVGTHSGSKAKG